MDKMNFKPWKSDVTKGVIVTSIFLSGFLFGMTSIVASAGALKLTEMGYPQNPLLLTFAFTYIPLLYVGIGIYFLNKEFVWRG